MTMEETRAPKKRSAKPTPSRCKAALSDARGAVLDRLKLQKAPTWDDATPATLLGLYAVLHEKTYNVKPFELEEAWFGAVSKVAKFVREHFDDTPSKAIDFLRWSWARERNRLKRGSTSDFRIGWNYQFSLRMLTDYRVSLQRDT
jgi:hypothetical protein